MRKLFMKGFSIRPLTLRSIGGHNVLIDAAHDLLDSIIESSGQHNRKSNESHT